MCVFFTLAAGYVVKAFRVIGHGLTEVPPLPEDPGIQGGTVGNKGIQSFFFFDLSCQDGKLKFFLSFLGNIADALRAKLPADNARQLRNDGQTEKRSQRFHQGGFADSACTNYDDASSLQFSSDRAVGVV